ncbi:MAG: hypothetical protein ACOX4U_00195 [Anaerovoracaceae bacterium]
MKTVLGIDIGSSTTKIVGYQDGEWIGGLQIDTQDQITALYGAIGRFIEDYDVAWATVSRIVLTGMGATRITGDVLNVPTLWVDEFEAIAKGGLHLANKEDAILVSMGTGTAYVLALGGRVSHIGGSGVGGGTLLGLSKILFKKEDFKDLLDLASKGNLSKVDLTIGDISDGDIETLPDYLTAANFGKVQGNATTHDVALGLVNMVVQTIGMLAVFAYKNNSVNHVILTGGLTGFPQVKETFQIFQELHNIEFIIPEKANFATAIGAVIDHV